MPHEKSLQCFLRRLLAMKGDVVEERGYSLQIVRCRLKVPRGLLEPTLVSRQFGRGQAACSSFPSRRTIAGSDALT